MQYFQGYERRILLVDDHKELREMVTDILKKEGFAHVQTAGSCRECLELSLIHI